MAWPVLPHGFLGNQGDNDQYQISRSLRFNSADSAYLNRTPASAGNRKTWTWSGWVKRSSLGSVHILMEGGSQGTTDSAFYFDSNDNLDFFNRISTSVLGRRITSQVFRDIGAWFHLVAVWDSSNATASERIKIYVNGSQITSFSTQTNPSLNEDSSINNSVLQKLGATGTPTPTGGYFGGYLAEVNFIDGQALTPSDFGETDATTGRWKAKAFTGTYGTNGFYLNFSDNSGTTSTTLGKDNSGNSNNWTPNNFSVTAGAGNDSLVDSPTNYGIDTGLGGEVRGNYATLNPLVPPSFTQGTLRNGNLEILGSASVANACARAGIAILGKAYAEFSFDVVSSFAHIGVVPLNDTAADGGLWGTGTNLTYRSNGDKRVMGTGTAYGASWAANDIIGVAVDPSANTVEFFKNGLSQGVIASSSFFAQGDCTFTLATDDVGSPKGFANFGQRPFAYTAPSGFKALCTTNLPTPVIKKPSSSMDVVTFNATGSNQSITGLNFQPDFVWIKNRANWAGNRHTLFDAVRGGQQRLDSSTTEAEAADNDLISFDANGFTGNLSGTTYVAWAWDAGSTTSTNNSGSITSTVSVNALAGFSIVSYTGTGANATVGHGLGVAPKMVIVKNRGSAQNWPVYHSGLSAAGNVIYLNLTNAQALTANMFNSMTTLNSTVFSVGSNANSNNNTESHIAYCFAEVEGYSKFGSYTGNSSTDGPFVWCGFRPRYWLIKRTDSASGWWHWDSARSLINPANSTFRLNSSSAEDTDSTNYNIDILSNGIKIRATSFTADGGMNVSGGTYVFAAFAESPFKYARAR